MKRINCVSGVAADEINVMNFTMDSFAEHRMESRRLYVRTEFSLYIAAIQRLAPGQDRRLPYFTSWVRLKLKPTSGVRDRISEGISQMD